MFEFAQDHLGTTTTPALETQPYVDEHSSSDSESDAFQPAMPYKKQLSANEQEYLRMVNQKSELIAQVERKVSEQE